MYTAHSDAELADIRAALPKYANDCTPEQAATDREVYAEQMRRYRAVKEAAAADYNRQAIEATGLRHGDQVEATFAGAFFSLDSFTGKVVYNRHGKLAVKTDRPDDTGRKMTPISRAWKRIA